MSSFFFVRFDLFFECVLFVAMEKTKTSKHKKSSSEIKTEKKKAFDMGVTFPLSQESELGDEDLNDLLEDSKLKNTKKCTSWGLKKFKK